MKKLILLGLFTTTAFLSFSQKSDYKPVIIGFYNLENLFDTLDNPMVNDEEFTPNGPRNYNGTIYFDKLGKLATVISQMGIEVNPDGPAILGVAEVENDTVLHDLENQQLIE